MTTGTKAKNPVEMLALLWERGCQAWPGVDLPRERFAAYVQARQPAETEMDVFLGKVHADGLYLAAACAEGDPAGHAAFDRHMLSQMPSFLSGIGASAALCDEVRQILREKLFMPGPTGGPRIAEYGGQGTLGSWLRVVALRAAVSLLRQREGPPTIELSEEALGGTPDPELAYFKIRYRDDFREAFREAVAGLTHEQRNLLRLHILDGMTIDDLGALLQVHRATAARRVASARVEVFERMRALLEKRLGMTGAEVESVMRAVRSQLDLSIQGALRSEE